MLHNITENTDIHHTVTLISEKRNGGVGSCGKQKKEDSGKKTSSIP
jgi:hypothetical protein